MPVSTALIPNKRLKLTAAIWVAIKGAIKPITPRNEFANPEYVGTRDISQNSQTTIIPEMIIELL